MEHHLKITPEYLQAVIEGRKTFEVRYNDRDFKEGDILRLRGYLIETDKYTGVEYTVIVVHILHWTEEQPLGLNQGYCIMSIIGYRGESIENQVACGVRSISDPDPSQEAGEIPKATNRAPRKRIKRIR